MANRLKHPFRWLTSPQEEAPLKDIEGGTNVSERFSHYITRSIQGFYRRRMISPVIYLVLLVVLFLIYPLASMLMPKSVKGQPDFEKLYTSRDRYVTCELKDLSFTGYTRETMGTTSGYYYYTIIDGKCVLVLLSPRTSEQGLPQIDSLRVTGRILKDANSRELVVAHLAEDLSWDVRGLSNSISVYMFSEPDASGWMTRLLNLIIIVTGIYALVSLLLDILFIAKPVLSWPVRRLAPYGHPAKLLEQAEEELATMPQLATEDMFITEHFFIETSLDGVAIVPISEILWIYKYSTLHRILWHHFSISYTLYIMTTHRQSIHCPKNAKSDIDGIMDYLAEANHDILVGFTEKNRLEVEKRLG